MLLDDKFPTSRAAATAEEDVNIYSLHASNPTTRIDHAAVERNRPRLLFPIIIMKIIRETYSPHEAF